jgi:hypothetical protein
MTTNYAASNRAQHPMMVSIMPGGASHCRTFQATCRTGGIPGDKYAKREDSECDTCFHDGNPLH